MATNPYCESIGIEVPCLEDLAPAKEPSIFHWMVLVLLEHGAPMTLEAIVERLDELGVESRTGDLAYSLRKAWHGLAPVYQDPTGLFGLEVEDWHLGHIARTAGLIAPPPTPPGPTRPGDDAPLTVEEMEALFAEGISAPSMLRVAAGVLEATGLALTLEELNAWVGARLRHGRYRPTLQSVRGWRSTMVTMNEAGQLVLDARSAELEATRRCIRDVVFPRLVRKAHGAAWLVFHDQRVAELAEENRQLAMKAADLRHALVHLVPDARAPAAAVVLDVESRVFRTWVGAVPSSVFDDFDVIIGVDVRHGLHSIGVPTTRPRGAPWRLVDLSPPKKTRTLNKQGRKLDITTDMLLRASTGMFLGDPARIAGYLATEDHARLAARLEADAKALFAYYMYGRLHGYVRLRWGFLDEVLGVSWALPGEATLRTQLEHAHSAGANIEVVLGNAPGWTDPWSRAKPGSAYMRAHSYGVDIEGLDVDLAEVQAMRPVGERSQLP